MRMGEYEYTSLEQTTSPPRYRPGLRSRRTLTQPKLTGCSRALCFHRLWHLLVRQPPQYVCEERLRGCAIDDEVLFRLVIDLAADDGKTV